MPTNPSRRRAQRHAHRTPPAVGTSEALIGEQPRWQQTQARRLGGDVRFLRWLMSTPGHVSASAGVLLLRTRAARSRRGDAGFASLELVILTPVIVLMLLLVVGFGRLTHGRQLVEQAASAAARAASLDSNASQATADAHQEASDVLSQAGVSCRSFSVDVDTSDFRAGGQVTVTVHCVTSLSDLGLVGFPGAKTLQASSTSPLEQFRQFSLGFSNLEPSSGSNRSAVVSDAAS
jgi:Flp pilus assembly protein TadG